MCLTTMKLGHSLVIRKESAVPFEEVIDMRFHDVLPKLELAQSVLHMFRFQRLLQSCQSVG